MDAALELGGGERPRVFHLLRICTLFATRISGAAVAGVVLTGAVTTLSAAALRFVFEFLL
jgi:hypothetical protein